MTVAVVWTLLIWSTPGQGGFPLAVIDGIPTEQHCRAMTAEITRRWPGLMDRPWKTACIQRQMVVASK